MKTDAIIHNKNYENIWNLNTTLYNNLDSSRAGKLIIMNCWQVVLSWVALYMSANSNSSQTLRRLTAYSTHIQYHMKTHSNLN